MRSISFKKSLSVLSLSTALLVAACGPDGGPNAGSADDAGAPTADAGSPTADAGGGAATPASQFLGTWTYYTGASLVQCSDGSYGELQAGGGTVTFTPGANGSRVVAVKDDGCAVACMISGTTATCEPGSCDAGNGAVAMVQSDVFTVSAGELDETSTIQYAASDGSTCTLALEDGVLKKSE